jgi:DNA-binding IclR family transcriptional regulator
MEATFYDSGWCFDCSQFRTKLSGHARRGGVVRAKGTGKELEKPASKAGHEPSKPARSAAERAQVTSVERALTVLELLANRRQGLTTSDLSRRAHVPKSTMSYLLRTLVRRGYVRRDPATGYHTLGTRLLTLGGQAMQGMELREVAMPYLRQIVDKTRLGAHLAILDHGAAVYIERIESPGFIKMAIWIGRRMPPQITAVGKALICQLDTHDIREIVANNPAPQGTPKSIQSLHRLYEELARTRERGYAIDDEESAMGVRCVAAPVTAASGEVVASLGVSATVSQLHEEYLPVVINIVRSAALKLSAQLGSRTGR